MRIARRRASHCFGRTVDIIAVVPDFEGYQFFVLADGTIVIVDPDTLHIVTIIAA